jgi:hypothetical protein
MMSGHYAPAYALKRRFPETPLWHLFLAVQALDVLFFLLVPIGIERVVLDPHGRMPLAMDLQFMPYSHSLLATLAYAGVAALVGRQLGRGRVGLAVACAIASHWLCDVLVHVPDVPVWSGDGLKLGLGIWHWPLAGVVVELGLLAAAYALLRPRLHAAARSPADLTFAALCLAQLLNDFVLPTPASVGQLAVSAQALFLGNTWLARRVDRATAAPGGVGGRGQEA